MRTDTLSHDARKMTSIFAEYRLCVDDRREYEYIRSLLAEMVDVIAETVDEDDDDHPSCQPPTESEGDENCRPSSGNDDDEICRPPAGSKEIHEFVESSILKKETEDVFKTVDDFDEEDIREVVYTVLHDVVDTVVSNESELNHHLPWRSYRKSASPQCLENETTTSDKPQIKFIWAKLRNYSMSCYSHLDLDDGGFNLLAESNRLFPPPRHERSFLPDNNNNDKNGLDRKKEIGSDKSTINLRRDDYSCLLKPARVEIEQNPLIERLALDIYNKRRARLLFGDIEDDRTKTTLFCTICDENCESRMAGIKHVIERHVAENVQQSILLPPWTQYLMARSNELHVQEKVVKKKKPIKIETIIENSQDESCSVEEPVDWWKCRFCKRFQKGYRKAHWHYQWCSSYPQDKEKPPIIDYFQEITRDAYCYVCLKCSVTRKNRKMIIKHYLTSHGDGTLKMVHQKKHFKIVLKDKESDVVSNNIEHVTQIDAAVPAKKARAKQAISKDKVGDDQSTKPKKRGRPPKILSNASNSKPSVSEKGPPKASTVDDEELMPTWKCKVCHRVFKEAHYKWHLKSKCRLKAPTFQKMFKELNEGSYRYRCRRCGNVCKSFSFFLKHFQWLHKAHVNFIHRRGQTFNLIRWDDKSPVDTTDKDRAVVNTIERRAPRRNAESTDQDDAEMSGIRPEMKKSVTLTVTGLSPGRPQKRKMKKAVRRSIRSLRRSARSHQKPMDDENVEKTPVDPPSKTADKKLVKETGKGSSTESSTSRSNRQSKENNLVPTDESPQMDVPEFVDSSPPPETPDESVGRIGIRRLRSQVELNVEESSSSQQESADSTNVGSLVRNLDDVGKRRVTRRKRKLSASTDSSTDASFLATATTQTTECASPEETTSINVSFIPLNSSALSKCHSLSLISSSKAVPRPTLASSESPAVPHKDGRENDSGNETSSHPFGLGTANAATTAIAGTELLESSDIVPPPLSPHLSPCNTDDTEPFIDLSPSPSRSVSPDIKSTSILAPSPSPPLSTSFAAPSPSPSASTSVAALSSNSSLGNENLLCQGQAFSSPRPNTQNNGVLVCSACDKVFIGNNAASELSAHKSQHETAPPPPPPPMNAGETLTRRYWDCKICRTRKYTLEEARQHLLLHGRVNMAHVELYFKSDVETIIEDPDQPVIILDEPELSNAAFSFKTSPTVIPDASARDTLSNNADKSVHDVVTGDREGDKSPKKRKRNETGNSSTHSHGSDYFRLANELVSRLPGVSTLVTPKAELDVIDNRDNIDDSGRQSSLSFHERDISSSRVRRESTPNSGGASNEARGSVNSWAPVPTASTTLTLHHRGNGTSDIMTKFTSDAKVEISNQLSRSCRFRCRLCVDFEDRRIHNVLHHMIDFHRIAPNNLNKHISGFNDMKIRKRTSVCIECFTLVSLSGQQDHWELNHQETQIADIFIELESGANEESAASSSLVSSPSAVASSSSFFASPASFSTSCSTPSSTHSSASPRSKKPSALSPNQNLDWADCVDLTEEEEDFQSSNSSFDDRKPVLPRESAKPMVPAQFETPAKLEHSKVIARTCSFRCHKCPFESKFIHDMIRHVITAHEIHVRHLHRCVTGYNPWIDGRNATTRFCLECFMIVTDADQHFRRYHSGSDWTMDNVYIGLCKQEHKGFP